MNYRQYSASKMDQRSPTELVLNNSVLVLKILENHLSSSDKRDNSSSKRDNNSLTARTLKLRLVNRIWCHTVSAIAFRNCEGRKLRCLKLLVEKGFNDYGPFITDARMDITQRYISVNAAGQRVSDLITCMRDGPLVNMENIVSIYLNKSVHSKFHDIDFEDLLVVLGTCKNVKYVTLENFLPSHLELALMKLKSRLPGARYNVKIESDNGNDIASVLAQLSPDITNSWSLSVSLYNYHSQRRFAGVEPIFNAINRCHQYWCKIASFELDFWTLHKSGKAFRSEYFRVLDPGVFYNIRSLTLFISRPSDESALPVGFELLRILKLCYSLTHLNVRTENGPRCIIDDKWIDELVTRTSNIEETFRSIEVRSLTLNEDKPAFTFDSLKSLKRCKKLESVILENLLPRPDKNGYLISTGSNKYWCRVMKFGLHKMPLHEEVWFPRLTKFDINSGDKWFPLMKSCLNYHMPLCEWHVSTGETATLYAPGC